MDLQDSVQRSLQNPAEKILQICTDSQRSKTWVVQQKEAQNLNKQPETDVEKKGDEAFTMTFNTQDILDSVCTRDG